LTLKYLSLLKKKIVYFKLFSVLIVSFPLLLEFNSDFALDEHLKLLVESKA